MQGILDLLLKQIFGQPFLLIPIVVFIGYLAMGQKISKALVGGIKASIGVLVMGMGSGALISNFNKVIAAVTTTTGAQGAGLNTYPTMTAGYAVMDSVLGEGTGATWGIYVLLVAFLLNILLVALRKYTHIRALYLTGNAMIVQAGISAFLVWKFLNTGAVATIAIASVLTALYWGIFSTMLIKPTHEITGADFTVAHQQMLSDYLAYKIAPHLGDPAKDDIEKKKLPEALNALQDNIISTFFIMFLSLLVIFIVVGNTGIDWLRSTDGLSQAGLKNNVVFLLWTATTLTANIYVLLAGVRMFVGEIMMSFKGISDKLLPGAVAGVDCAAIYSFAPKSVVLGLLFGTVGQLIGLLLLVVFKSPIFLIPGFIPLFFDNATIAIYANHYGGWKAAAIIVTINAIIQILGSALVIMMTNLTWWQGSSDYATIWLAITWILKMIGGAMGIVPAA